MDDQTPHGVDDHLRDRGLGPTLMAGPCALFHFTRVRLAVLERRYVV